MGKLGALAMAYSPTVSHFYNLRDTELGKANYREATSAFKVKSQVRRKRIFINRFRSIFDSNYVCNKIKKT